MAGIAKPEIAWEVPTYSCTEFKPRSSRFSVCIPVINEGNRIIAQLQRMAAFGISADIIIGDGGSTDGTNRAEVLAPLNVRSLLIKTGPGKLSAQLRMLFAYSIEQGYEGCVTLDGNGKDGIEAIPSFLEALDRGYDYVQGSRFLPGGAEHNTPLDRKLGAMLIHAPLISLAAGFRYTDTTNGFRAFSARFLADPVVRTFRNIFDTYNLHYYLSIKAARLGYRIKELPVIRTYPPSGPTPSKISGFSGKLDVLKMLILAVTGRYNPR